MAYTVLPHTALHCAREGQQGVRTWSALAWENIGAKNPDLPKIKASLEANGVAFWEGWTISIEVYAHTRPCAAKGFNSYRYDNGARGVILIGAKSVADALEQAQWSLSGGEATAAHLEVWKDGEGYVKAS